MASQWVRKWAVPGSKGNTWTVSVDETGLNYGCSCPVWRFKRQDCKHIDAVKAGLFGTGENYREAMPGNVGEVTIQGDKVLYPLVPLGGGPDLPATIVFDLMRANVRPEQINSYKMQMFGKAPLKQEG